MSLVTCAFPAMTSLISAVKKVYLIEHKFITHHVQYKLNNLGVKLRLDTGSSTRDPQD